MSSGLHVTVHHASALNSGKTLYSHVVTRFRGVEAATAVSRGKGPNPQWDETLRLEGEEIGDGVGKLTVDVYGGNDSHAKTHKLIATAVLHITEDTPEKVSLCLRKPSAPPPAHATPPGTPSRQPVPQESAGEIVISWRMQMAETAFKASLVRLLSASQIFIEPMLWIASLVTWERPFQTGFFLTLFTYTCWYSQFDLIIPVVVIAILLNAYVRHFRYGPSREIKSEYEATSGGVADFGLRLLKAPLKLTMATEQKLPAEIEEDMCNKHEVLTNVLNFLDLAYDVLAVGSPAGLAVAGVAPGMPAPSSAAKAKKRRSALRIRTGLVYLLLFWTLAEIFGLCPPLGLMTLAVVWGGFVWYPMQQAFPTIREAAHTFLLEEHGGVPAVVADADVPAVRIHYSPQPQPHAATYLAPTSASGKSKKSPSTVTSSASPSVVSSPRCGLTYESLGATSDLSGIESSLPSPATTPPTSPRSPADAAPREVLAPVSAAAPVTPAAPVTNTSAAWPLVSAGVTTHEERGGVTYFRVKATLSDDTKDTWHRYSQFRNLRSHAMEHSHQVKDIAFPGKTFGKCEGSSLATREKELNAFLGELRKIAVNNKKVRAELSKFLGVPL